MNFISVENLSYHYESNDENNLTKVDVIKNLNMEVKKGEFLCVLGHNGSGKSTLAKHFNAILLPCGGKVYVDKMDTADEEKCFDIRSNVGLVLQNPDNQLVASVVEEDVAFGPENLGVPPKEIRKRVDNASKAVDMYEYRKNAPYKLSGGQKQRLSIARAITTNPEIYIFDDSFSALDFKTDANLRKALFKETKDSTILIVAQRISTILNADQIIVLDEGKIVGIGSHKELMKKWGLGDNYVGVGNVVLGYRDMILPPASPRKEDYIIFD